MRPTILVVDDSQLVREMVRDTFLESGFSVITASNGTEGLARLAEERPDLILSDVLMPELDGWDFCDAVKGDPHTRDIPLLFLSSERDVPHRLRGLRMGAYDYLTKPFSTEELVLRVRMILKRISSGSAGGETSRAFLSGHTSHLPIADLVQLLAMNGKTGCLRLRSLELGRIHFRDGRIVGAFTALTRGRKALFRMLGWEDTDFHFDPVDDPSVTEDLEVNTQRLLMDALVELDDLRRLAVNLPDNESVIELAEGARKLLEAPGNLSPIELSLLAEAREGTTLGAVLDRIDATDLEVARGVSHLLGAEALVTV